MNPRRRAYLMLFTVALIWGLATPVIKQTFHYLPPDIFLAYRFFLSALIMVPLLLVTQPRTWKILADTSASAWILLTVAGLLGSVLQLGFLFWGLDLTSTIDASIINSSSPITVALAGYIFLREKISLREKIGLVTAFIGSILIIIQPLLETKTLVSGSLVGNLLVALGTLAWVGYVILTKKQLRHAYSPLFLTTFMFFVGFLVMFAFVLLRHTPADIRVFLSSPPSAHLGVIYMSVFSGSLAYWLYQKAQKTIEVSEANVFLYLPPLFTAPLSFFWFHEPLTFPLVIGCLVITLGVFIANLKPARSQHVG